MRSLAVITARGGSKRIPRKNVRDFCGKPIISYSIASALRSGLFDEVMVSTDDDEIASIARGEGASVPFMRSAAASDDHATTADVLLEVLGEYGARGETFDRVCCIYPTAPFVTPEKIDAAFTMLGEDVNTVLTATEFSCPPQRGLVEDDGYLKFWFPQYELTRSQDLPPIYHDAGQLYWRLVPDLMASGRLVGDRARALPVSQAEVQDIDNESDWLLAELKYRALLERGSLE